MVRAERALKGEVTMNAVGSDDCQRQISRLLDFWFGRRPTDADQLAALKQKWFASTAEQDDEIREKFGALAERAATGELDGFTATPEGRLALIILLDQIPRCIFRGTAEAFSRDDKALRLTLEGMEEGEDLTLEPLQRLFFCMPLQHSEDPAIQARSVRTFEALARDAADTAVAGMLAGAAGSAHDHHAIVQRFGRFPHRNDPLRRESTPAELDYLASGGKRFGQ
jgi:uncharacterized protein (DUF924 family)